MACDTTSACCSIGGVRSTYLGDGTGAATGSDEVDGVALLSDGLIVDVVEATGVALVPDSRAAVC